jgi:hypothetical protein
MCIGAHFFFYFSCVTRIHVLISNSKPDSLAFKAKKTFNIKRRKCIVTTLLKDLAVIQKVFDFTARCLWRASQNTSGPFQDRLGSKLELSVWADTPKRNFLTCAPEWRHSWTGSGNTTCQDLKPHRIRTDQNSIEGQWNACRGWYSCACNHVTLWLNDSWTN